MSLKEKSLWAWDPKSKRYRNTKTGRFIGFTEMIGLRDKFTQAQADILAQITQKVFDGKINVNTWVRQTRKVIRASYTDMYALAKGGRFQLTQADLQRIEVMVREQYVFLNNFGDALPNMTDGAARARASMYAHGSTSAFEEAKAGSFGIVLPQYPGDGGTRCLSNCKCHWSIVEQKTQIKAYWKLEAGADHCADCLANASNYAPLIFAKSNFTVDDVKELLNA